MKRLSADSENNTGCGRSEPKLAGKRRPCRPAPKALSMGTSRDSSS